MHTIINKKKDKKIDKNTPYIDTVRFWTTLFPELLNSQPRAKSPVINPIDNQEQPKKKIVNKRKARTTCPSPCLWIPDTFVAFPWAEPPAAYACRSPFE